jgi:hypothetical protein
MGTIAAAALMIGLGTAMVAVLQWLISRGDRKRRQESVAFGERFRRRLESPDLAGLERHLGHPPSASLRALYADRDLVMSDDIVISVPNPLQGSKESYIAWFEPADAETLAITWPGCEGLFPFADNGAGDRFLVDPRDSDPEVIYYLHETGEKRALGVSLSAFLAAPRRPLSEQ